MFEATTTAVPGNVSISPTTQAISPMTSSIAQAQSAFASLFAPPPAPVPIPVMTPPIPVAKITLMTADDIALATAPDSRDDLMYKHQHECRMNYWYIGELTRENAAKVQIYMQAWQNWVANASQYRALNLPIPPPPQPPVLADVGPMPAGYWFG